MYIVLKICIKNKINNLYYNKFKLLKVKYIKFLEKRIIRSRYMQCP